MIYHMQLFTSKYPNSLKHQSRKNLFVHYVFRSCPIVLRFSWKHGRITAVLRANSLNAAKIDDVSELEFVRCWLKAFVLGDI